ncbi:MAG: hypothetical protein LBC82_04615 [Oscillospiraceae bacterium]|jgi:hypothetical protein|nr:hypothetical protein [Oscillospiraceae bacterium]
MLTAKQIEGLKKTNLSIDAQKSKDRISEGFKTASADIKKKITELSGLNRATFYNAFQKGSASPKMVLSMAQLLGVSPYYYTGEADEKGEFSEELLKSFLNDKKLVASAKKAPAKAKVAVDSKPAKKPGRKPAVKAVPVEVAEPKKRGRKPAVKAIPTEVAEPKKRGRKPASTVKAPVAKAPKAPVAKAPRTPKANDEILMQISIEKTPKLQKAIANLDEESAVLLLRALIRKAGVNDQSKALCDIIKSCLLS